MRGAVMYTCVGGDRLHAANFRDRVPGVELGGGYTSGELGPSAVGTTEPHALAHLRAGPLLGRVGAWTRRRRLPRPPALCFAAFFYDMISRACAACPCRFFMI